VFEVTGSGIGRIVIADYGLAVLTKKDKWLYVSNENKMVVGTLAFIAPELLHRWPHTEKVLLLDTSHLFILLEILYFETIILRLIGGALGSSHLKCRQPWYIPCINK
jgi:hypothetical protein